MVVAPCDSFFVKPGNRKVKGKCEDTFAYRNVDRGRTYGPEDRCCLFLTGPDSSTVSDEEMFIRSSKVVIVDVKVEDARNERKEREGDDEGKRRKTEEVNGGNNSVSLAIPCRS